MKPGLERHNEEIQRNRAAWEKKPLLRDIYAGFYEKIVRQIEPRIAGAVVEVGSGIGNLKSHFPGAIATDLFPNPGLDVVCDGYELPFRAGSLSHLVLFDVFHHLAAPMAFLEEARRALTAGGRLLVFEPFISASSLPVYGLLHSEPIALRKSIDLGTVPPHPRSYYAAQGNATRLFFQSAAQVWLKGWRILHKEAFSAFAYLLSGGYSRPAFYPRSGARTVLRLDAVLSRWPRLFGARCLVVLQRE